MAHEINGDFYKGNYVEQEFYIEKPNAVTGEMEPATDIAGLEIWVAAVDGGDPIDNTLRRPANMRAGNPGYWFAAFPGSLFDPIFFPVATPLLMDKKRIWVIMRDPAGIVNVSVPRRAYAVRSV